MSRYIGPGKVEIWFVPTIADITAPTTTQLNAGTAISPYVVDGGADFPNPGTTVDASDGGSAFDKQVRGTTGGQKAVLTCHRDDQKANDTAWTTLAPTTQGFIAIAPRGLATFGTWAVGDAVDVFAIEVITRDPSNLMARNATQQFTVEMAITDTPTYDFDLTA